MLREWVNYYDSPFQRMVITLKEMSFYLVINVFWFINLVSIIKQLAKMSSFKHIGVIMVHILTRCIKAKLNGCSAVFSSISSRICNYYYWYLLFSFLFSFSFFSLSFFVSKMRSCDCLRNLGSKMHLQDLCFWVK